MFGSIDLLSNGSLFVFENGINIFSISDADNNIISASLQSTKFYNDCKHFENGMYFHELRDSDNILCAKFNDVVNRVFSSFVRKGEVYSDIDFIINFPPDCTKRIISNYKIGKSKNDVLLAEYYTQNGMHCVFSAVCTGSACLDYIDDYHVVRFGKGKGSLIISSGNIAFVEYNSEKAMSNEGVNETVDYWKNIVSAFCDFSGGETEKTLYNVIPSFLMYQKSNGDFYASHENFGSALRENCCCVRALCKLRLRERAEMCLKYIAENIDNNKLIYNTSSYSSAYCDVLEAFGEYRKAFPKGEAFEKNISLIKKMFYFVEKEAGKGVIPFSEDDCLIKNKTLSYGNLIQGSFCDTVRFIGIFDYYSDIFPVNKKSDGKTVIQSRLKDNFYDNDTVYYNSVSQINRIPKYLYGYCDCCNNDMGFNVKKWLTRNDVGDYVCFDCFNSSEFSSPYDLTEKHNAAKVYLTGCLFESPLKNICIEKTKIIADDYYKNGFFVSDKNTGKMLFSDLCLLIEVISIIDRANTEKAIRILLNIVNQIGIFSEYEKNYGGTGVQNGVYELSLFIDCLLKTQGL